MLVEPGFFRTDLLTPESTNYAEPSIDDYAERTKQTVAAWNGMNGLQGGDPAKLATALVQLAGQDEPPLRWAAGADAVGVVEQKAKHPARPGRRPPRTVLVARPRRRLLNLERTSNTGSARTRHRFGDQQKITRAARRSPPSPGVRGRRLGVACAESVPKFGPIKDGEAGTRSSEGIPGRRRAPP